MRIIDYPEANTIEDDDYIIMDKANGTPIKILASYFGQQPPAPIEYLYNWDFTKETNPLIDSVRGSSAILFESASVDTDGLKIPDASSGAWIPFKLQIGYIYELDIDNINPEANQHQRFIMGSPTEGFIIRYVSNHFYWNVYGNSNHWCQNIDKSTSIFNNSTLKLVYEDFGFITVYSDDTLIFQSDEEINWRTKPFTNYFAIGSNQGLSIYDITIKALRIYKNSQYTYTDIAIWDFSSNTPFVDTLNGEILTDNDVTVNNGIATLNSSTSYLKLPNSLIFDPDSDEYIGLEYYIENFQYISGTRLFVLSDNWGSSSDTMLGLIYFNNGWNLWYDSTRHLIPGMSSTSAFDNSTIKIRFFKEIVNNTNYVSIQVFKGNDLLITGSITKSTYETFTSLSVGSHRNVMKCSFEGFKIRKITEEV